MAFFTPDATLGSVGNDFPKRIFFPSRTKNPVSNFDDIDCLNFCRHMRRCCFWFKNMPPEVRVWSKLSSRLGDQYSGAEIRHRASGTIVECSKARKGPLDCIVVLYYCSIVVL